ALGPRSERVGAHACEHFERDAEVVARLDAAPLTPQPLAVEQVGPGDLYANAGAAQPMERFLVEALGVLAVAEQRARPGLDPERPIGAAVLRGEGELLECAFWDLVLSGSSGGLNELGDCPLRAQLGIRCEFDGIAHGGGGLLVAAETVVKDRGRVPGERLREALLSRDCVPGEILGQGRQLWLATAEGGQQ